MNTRIHSVHFHADVKLLGFIEEKLQKIEHFFDQITSTEIFLKLDKHSLVKDKVVEIKVGLPGKTLFCEDSSKSFEQSFEAALHCMVQQVRKHKEKIRA